LQNENSKEFDQEEKLKEALRVLLFDGYFDTTSGPQCSCSCVKLTRFMGKIPHVLLSKALEEVDLTELEGRKFSIDSMCDCQRVHSFSVIIENGVINYSEVTARLRDRRSLRLPNFKE
jgi:hypothetical protein